MQPERSDKGCSALLKRLHQQSALQRTITDIDSYLRLIPPPKSREAALIEYRLIQYFRSSKRKILTFASTHPPMCRMLLKRKHDYLLDHEFEKLSRRLPDDRRERIRGRIRVLIGLELAKALAQQELRALQPPATPSTPAMVSAPATAAARTKKKAVKKHAPNPILQDIYARIRQLRKGGATSVRELCDRLGNSPFPPGAHWDAKNWPMALKKYPRRVYTWFSKARKHC